MISQSFPATYVPCYDPPSEGPVTHATAVGTPPLCKATTTTTVVGVVVVVVVVVVVADKVSAKGGHVGVGVPEGHLVVHR